MRGMQAWLDTILSRPAPEAAPALLGARLRCGVVRAVITEVEAYHGEEDLACHASKGQTPRNQMLYRRHGTVYCYLCYGIHVLWNIVCGPEGVPAAVLIRAVLVTHGVSEARRRRGGKQTPLARLSDGPGKVTQALDIGLQANGLHVDDATCPFSLQPGLSVPSRAVSCGPRVGVAYAGEHWAAMPWRWRIDAAEQVFAARI